jgi:hypothetical protein
MQLQQEQKSSRIWSFQVPPYIRKLTVGIGGFCILDDKITDGEDAGVNFFLESASIGSRRAEQAYKYVSELNPDVEGDYFIHVTPTKNILTCRMLTLSLRKLLNGFINFRSLLRRG